MHIMGLVGTMMMLDAETEIQERKDAHGDHEVGCDPRLLFHKKPSVAFRDK